MALSDQNSSVQSRADLAAFIRSLRQDFHVNPTAWENDTLELFLEALAAWIDDMEGYYRNQGKPLPDTPDWKMVADMLTAARQYE